jgi:hypothetical protein
MTGGPGAESIPIIGSLAGRRIVVEHFEAQQGGCCCAWEGLSRSTTQSGQEWIVSGKERAKPPPIVRTRAATKTAYSSRTHLKPREVEWTGSRKQACRKFQSSQNVHGSCRIPVDASPRHVWGRRPQVDTYVPKRNIIPIDSSIFSCKRLGGALQGTDSMRVLELIKYTSTGLEYFQYPNLQVVESPNAFTVQLASAADFIPVSLVHDMSEAQPQNETSTPMQIHELPDFFSVDCTGGLRLTTALIARPEESMVATNLLQTIRSHPAFNFLEDVDCTLMEMRCNQWSRTNDFSPATSPERFGLLVRRHDVGKVNLVFDNDRIIPILFCRKPESTVLESVKSSCDWTAWPAVSECTQELVVVQDSEGAMSIRVPGAVRAHSAEYAADTA